MYDRLYVEYVYYFNIERDYYECHEVMEEYWLLEGKNKLLQALLQVAVGLYHFQNNNISGAIKLFEQALDKQYEPWNGTTGIDLEQLFSDVKTYVEKLYGYQQQPFSYYHLTITIKDEELEKLVSRCVPKGVAEEDKF